MQSWEHCQLPAEWSHFLGPFSTLVGKDGPQGIEESCLSLVIPPCPLHQGWHWAFYIMWENAVAWTCTEG